MEAPPPPAATSTEPPWWLSDRTRRNHSGNGTGILPMWQMVEEHSWSFSATARTPTTLRCDERPTHSDPYPAPNLCHCRIGLWKKKTISFSNLFCTVSFWKKKINLFKIFSQCTILNIIFSHSKQLFIFKKKIFYTSKYHLIFKMKRLSLYLVRQLEMKILNWNELLFKNYNYFRWFFKKKIKNYIKKI